MQPQSKSKLHSTKCVHFNNELQYSFLIFSFRSTHNGSEVRYQILSLSIHLTPFVERDAEQKHRHIVRGMMSAKRTFFSFLFVALTMKHFCCMCCRVEEILSRWHINFFSCVQVAENVTVVFFYSNFLPSAHTRNSNKSLSINSPKKRSKKRSARTFSKLKKNNLFNSILANMDREALKKQIENMKYQATMERWPLSKSIQA